MYMCYSSVSRTGDDDDTPEKKNAENIKGRHRERNAEWMFIYIQLTFGRVFAASCTAAVKSGQARERETRPINLAEKPGIGLHGTLATVDVKSRAKHIC